MKAGKLKNRSPRATGSLACGLSGQGSRIFFEAWTKRNSESVAPKRPFSSEENGLLEHGLLVFGSLLRFFLISASAVQDGLQLGVIFSGKRGLKHRAAGAAQFVEHLVGQRRVDQQKQGRGTGSQFFGKLFS